jgi:hypothetical protein
MLDVHEYSGDMPTFNARFAPACTSALGVRTWPLSSGADDRGHGFIDAGRRPLRLSETPCSQRVPSDFFFVAGPMGGLKPFSQPDIVGWRHPAMPTVVQVKMVFAGV